MIVEIEATVTIEEKHYSDNYTGKGSCIVFKERNLRGQWELPNGHPNLDCYGYSVDTDRRKSLLENIGFNPEENYEIEDMSISIWGNDEEWLEQAKTLHDGRFSDNPEKALEGMASWENSKLEEREIDRILADN